MRLSLLEVGQLVWKGDRFHRRASKVQAGQAFKCKLHIWLKAPSMLLYSLYSAATHTVSPLFGQWFTQITPLE